MNSLVPYSFYLNERKTMLKNTQGSHKPIFPEFKKLELEDREWMEEYIRQYPPYSDFNFASLWSWNINEQAEVSILYDNLIIRFHDYITREPFYTFLGVNKPSETVDLLLNESIKRNMKPILRLIPESTIDKLQTNKNYKLIEDIDNYDYVYSVSEHQEMKGRQYMDKRYLIKKFKENNPHYKLIKVDLKDKQVQNELTNFVYLWELIRNKDNKELKNEHEAIQRLFCNAHKFDLHGLAIMIDHSIKGFSINESIHNSYAITHFEKVDVTIKGISSYFRQEISSYLALLGCKYINYEQDLGIAGLRKAKNLWRPIHHLKKYIIQYNK